MEQMEFEDYLLALVQLIFSWRIIFVAITLAASYYVPRFIYSIDKQLKQNDRMIKLLEGIYEQNGGDVKKLFPDAGDMTLEDIKKEEK